MKMISGVKFFLSQAEVNEEIFMNLKIGAVKFGVYLQYGTGEHDWPFLMIN